MLILVAVSVKILIDSNIIGNAQSAAEQTKTKYAEEGQMGEITVDGKKYASAQDYVDNNEMSDPALNPSGTIPEGGTYYVGLTTNERGVYSGATATYTAGQAFPTTVSAGDKYVYGDYEYRYGFDPAEIMDLYAMGNRVGHYQDDATYGYDGWAVYALDTSKETFGPILESINGKNIKIMKSAFCLFGTVGFENMKQAPKIPNSVWNLEETFAHCTGLTSAPVIPSSVTNMSTTFSRCISLKGNVKIDANPTSYSSCFYNCAQDADHAITITGSASAETKAALKATGYNSGANISY